MPQHGSVVTSPALALVSVNGLTKKRMRIRNYKCTSATARPTAGSSSSSKLTKDELTAKLSQAEPGCMQ